MRFSYSLSAVVRLLLAVAVLVVGAATLGSASRADTADIVTLEAAIFQESDGSLVGEFGPWAWDDQVWMFSGAPVDEYFSLEVMAHDGQGRLLYSGEITGVWIDSFYAPFGSGTVLLSATDEGIAVLVDPFIEVGTIELFPVATTVDLAVDIKPWSSENPFNVRSRGVLPVVVPGTADFDVNLIDRDTIVLAGTAPVRARVADVLGVVLDEEGEVVVTQSEPDGFEDLLLHFKSTAVAEFLSDAGHGDIVTLVLTATLTDGTTSAEGADVVRVIRRGRPKCRPKSKPKRKPKCASKCKRK